MNSTTTDDAVLTAGEMCDRCNAMAKVGLLSHTLGTLAFCKHHFEEKDNEQVLLEKGFVVVEDRRSQLTAKPQSYEDDT